MKHCDAPIMATCEGSGINAECRPKLQEAVLCLCNTILYMGLCYFVRIWSNDIDHTSGIMITFLPHSSDS